MILRCRDQAAQAGLPHKACVLFHTASCGIAPDCLYLSCYSISTGITQLIVWQVHGSLEDAWQKLEGSLVFRVLHRLERVPEAFSFVARLPAAQA